MVIGTRHRQSQCKQKSDRKKSDDVKVLFHSECMVCLGEQVASNQKDRDIPAKVNKSGCFCSSVGLISNCLRFLLA
jgi:hypothetical protein